MALIYKIAEIQGRKRGLIYNTSRLLQRRLRLRFPTDERTGVAAGLVEVLPPIYFGGNKRYALLLPLEAEEFYVKFETELGEYREREQRLKEQSAGEKQRLEDVKKEREMYEELSSWL